MKTSELRNLVFCLVVIVFSFSCAEKNKETNRQTVLNIDAKDLKGFDEVITEIEFIPLLIPEDNPIKLLPLDPYLYVEDRIYFSNGDFRDASIHIFELDGTYLNSFNKQGQGPGEYRSISGLDKSGNELLVWDGSGTISHFNVEDLSFVKKTEFVKDRFIPDYKNLGNGKWLLVFDIGEEIDANGYYKGFYIWDEQTKEVEALDINVPPLATEMVEGQIAQIDDQSYLLNFGTSDTLYLYTDGTIDPILVFNFNNNNLPEKDKLTPEETIENALLNQLYSFNMGGVVVTDATIRIPIFGIKKSENMNPQIMETFPINYLFINYPEMEFKITKAFGNFSGKGFAKNGYFYELLYAEKVMAYLENKAFGKFSSQFEEAVGKLIDTEDPVIMKYKVGF